MHVVRGCQQQFVLPVRCSRCGQFFDLSYDILVEEPMMQEFVALMRQREVQDGMLCWDCR